MYQKIGLNIIAILCLGVFQIAFIANLPGWLSAIDLILVALVFVLSLNSLPESIVWAIGIGWVSDALSFYPFGLNIIILSLTAFFGYLLLTYVLTNRSLYSFVALASLMFIIKEMLKFILLFSAKLFWQIDVENIFSDLSYLKYKSMGLAIDLFLVIIIFNFINFASYRLRPVFLLKNRK